MSFLTPLFLIGAAAAAIPVLLHLVRRVKAKPVPFSSLMFLRAIDKEMVRRRRLRDLLLLLLRVSLILLLALAFARPFFDDEVPLLGSSEERESVVLLVDRSYSMRYADWFERVRSEARERIEAAHEDDELAVVAFDESAEVLAPLGAEQEVLRTVVSDVVEPTYRPTDFYRAFRLADEVLADARHDRRVVVLLSDFQQNGWSGAFENWKLDPDVVFEPVKVADAPAALAWVDALEVTQKRTGEQVALRFDALVRREGDPDASAAVLQLDGAELDRRALPDRETTQLAFQELAPRSGVLQGALSIGVDAMGEPAAYYLTLAVEERPQFLVVDADGSGGAVFLRNAFDLGEQALYRASVGGPGRISRSGLRDIAVVLLTDTQRLTAGQWDVLDAYVGDGGHVVLGFGEGSTGAGAERLGVGRFEGIENVGRLGGDAAIIGEVDLQHPIFRLFGESGVGSIFRPKFRKYARIAPDSAAVVLGRYDDGRPFLIERARGGGKVLAYTSSFGTAWTDFPINELYLPFLYETARYLLEGGGRQRQYVVGEGVPLVGRPGETWEIEAPGNRIFRVDMDERGRGLFLDTDRPGQYTAARGRDRLAFSVNIDPVETRLATRDPEATYAAVVRPREDVARTPEQAAVVDAADAEARQRLWRYLIFAALAVFLLESVLANRKRPSPYKAPGP